MKCPTIAAVVAAGLMSFLPCVQLAEAKVVYTPVNVSISGIGSVSFDLNHDKVFDFTIRTTYTWAACGILGRVAPLGSITITPTPGGVVVTPNTSIATLAPSGVKIGTTKTFYASKALIRQFFLCGGASYISDSGYLGLKFKINGQTHYGWAQVSYFGQVRGTTFAPRTTLVDFAYETIASQPITTGQTSGFAEIDAVGSSSKSTEGWGITAENRLEERYVGGIAPVSATKQILVARHPTSCKRQKGFNLYVVSEVSRCFRLNLELQQASQKVTLNTCQLWIST